MTTEYPLPSTPSIAGAPAAPAFGVGTATPPTVPSFGGGATPPAAPTKLPSFGGPDLDEILTIAVNQGASDIHISAFTPPMMRVDGDLERMKEFPEPLTPEWISKAMEATTKGDQWERFLQHLELDKSYIVEGAGRFRQNVMHQRGHVAAVFRIIPTIIKSLEELKVPAILGEIAKKPKGLVLVTGPTGSGKALGLSTPLPTPTGWTTMGEVKVGDALLDSKGKPCEVTGLSPINKTPNLYRLTLSDGQELIADGDHQWVVSSHRTRNGGNHPKAKKIAANAQKGQLAGIELQLLSKRYPASQRSTLAELLAIVAATPHGSYFPSVGSIRASLGFMDVPLAGGGGSVPLSCSTRAALFALGLRLLQRYERPAKSPYLVLSTSEMLELGVKDNGRTNFAIHVTELQGEERDLPIDPYVLGAWLGDGISGAGAIVSGLEDSPAMEALLRDAWRGVVRPTYGARGTRFILGRDESRCIRGHEGFTRGVKCRKCEQDYSAPLANGSLGEILAQAGLRNNKHIPREYLRASRSQRLALLQGLMDTDGSIQKNGHGMGMGFSNEMLARGAFELVRSLGIKAKMRQKKAGYRRGDGSFVRCRDSYSIEFMTTLPVFRLERKLARMNGTMDPRQEWLHVRSIDPVMPGDPLYEPARCLSVDSEDRTYLCGDFVTTHNSTTLAAMIDAINDTRPDHIMTIEDPIEFVHQNKRCLINQREVGSDTKSFAEALKRVLRQDPDVILVGELRDPETISVALTAAETGHLVFGTLHTQSANKTINRLIDSFPAHQQNQVRSQLSDTLQAVVAQSLLKKIGGGRVAATEIMVRTDAIGNLIREGNIAQMYSAIQTGSTHGMHTLDQDLQRLVSTGVVSRDEAWPYLIDKQSLDGLTTRRIDDNQGWEQY